MVGCVVCGGEVKRTGSRGPIPKYCSQRCIFKAKRTPKRIEYERQYRRNERTFGKRKAYEFAYNRRPEVRERNRQRMFMKWHTDPEWRQRELIRMRRTIHPEIVVPEPYTGHRWLDMARKMVVGNGFDGSTMWADDKYDEMGEAVLALLEGRDMQEAVTNYRKQEYVPRNLTIHLGDWGDDEEAQTRWFETAMPRVESAEDEAIARVYVADKFNDVATKNRGMKHKTQQPSRRRMKDAGWRKHERR